ncbi:restriction endonuclease [Streptomyces albospinus]|uniref:Restriction endonuclease n=1 Tax=Streptomyces albospinus TaxID=285515 RepID=A0ABQ2V9W4_9ACTN|nr:restriction endonuclease [Streptomyces albospinus]GGU73200.1 restriction endonuclease [Streptomyces albospinus]
MVTVGAVAALVQWLLVHWWLLVILGVAAGVGGGLWLRQRQQRAAWERVKAAALRFSLQQIDALHWDAFEFAVRDLLRRDGCTAEKTGGRGDDGCDVLGTDPQGRRWVVQCKHRKDGLNGKPVGVPDLQVLNGTARQIHGADVVVLVTNGRVTKTAWPWARDQKIHVVDRHALGEWASGSRPLWETLSPLPPPRRTDS